MAEVSDETIQQFMALTNVSHNIAVQYLSEFGDLNEALNSYYASQADDEKDRREEAHWNRQQEKVPKQEALSSINSLKKAIDEENVGGLGSKPVLSQGSNEYLKRKSSTSPEPAKGNSRSGSGNSSRFMSFSDMVRGQADDDDEDQPRNTFAGGETSGLEVTDPSDPNSLLKDLLEKARRGGQMGAEDESRDDEEHEVGANRFAGRGFRLGSTIDATDQVVEDNTSQPQRRKPEKVTREITFWKEGFQVANGPLYRYDDPANSFYLSELNQGRAPLKLLDVEFGQEVEVNVYKKLDEPYRAPKRKLGGFSGQGQRLGSPIPGESLSPAEIPRDETPVAQEQSKPDNEPKKGDTSIQIRYANGKREVLRCSSTDTVKFLYDHVTSNPNTDTSRNFTLNHAFPIKPISNDETTLKDADLLNSVVVQRWA
ncbi:protein phosphatase regulator SHP1 [Saccharomyces paradoxus]|uniref:Protein phosphatase regulator SHP1 n=1 Tax=Saccharomyces paradoxus TaxID=27291 RepID=A0A8B8UL97_SACPA|nr:Shp1 [Saccharomyces paradoxus]QHS71510.1 Shp1 [Saccharomyces paradoxus]